MDIEKSLKRTIFHELGHVVVSLLNGNKIEYIELSLKNIRAYNNDSFIDESIWGGSVFIREDVKDFNVNKMSNIDALVGHILNYLAGSVFEGCYLRSVNIINNPFDLFDRQKNSENSDSYKLKSLLESYDLENRKHGTYNKVVNSIASIIQWVVSMNVISALSPIVENLYEIVNQKQIDFIRIEEEDLRLILKDLQTMIEKKGLKETFNEKVKMNLSSILK